MANLVRWDPYQGFLRIRDEFDRLLSTLREPWFETNGAEAGWRRPAVDIRETDADVIVTAEIPGVEPEDIDITVSEDAVSIRAETKQETDVSRGDYRHVERRYGRFQRVLALPVPVKYEQAKADYRNGVLEIKIPKAEPARAKSIKLRVNPQA